MAGFRRRSQRGGIVGREVWGEGVDVGGILALREEVFSPTLWVFYLGFADRVGLGGVFFGILTRWKDGS